MPLNEILAILMLVSFFVLLLAGIPVALTLATTGFVFGYHRLRPAAVQSAAEPHLRRGDELHADRHAAVRVHGRDAGEIRLAEDLMEVIAHAAGSLRGGLGIGIILVGVLMGATTGIVGATVVTLGLLTLPTLLRRGYDKGLACGVICASGTLGQIIPPSLILILLADILNESVGTLFAAAMIPGLMLAGIYVVYLLGLGIVRPAHGAAVPQEERDLHLARRACRQAVARGAAADRAGRRGARLDHRRHRRADRGRLDGRARRHRGHGHRRAHVVGGAARHHLRDHPHHRDDDVHPDLRAGVLARLPRPAGREAGAGLLRASCRAAPTARIWFLMFIIFILGFFIEWIEISYIAVPLFLPIFIAANVDMVWLATLICVNLQTSFLTPPFGWALFFLRGVAPPEVTTGDIYRGIVPFVGMQLIALVLCFLFPAARALAAEDDRLVSEARGGHCRVSANARRGRPSARASRRSPRPRIRCRPCRPSRR